MPKNIVILMDGTGQEGGRGEHLNTNVYKMYTLLEERSHRQILFYDRGVGTGWPKLTGNVGGAGISMSILRAYRFIHDHYEDRDRIFLIGFSRGATAVRSLANFLHAFQFLPASRPDLIQKAWAIYRTRAPLRWSARRRILRHPGFDSSGRWWTTLAKWLTRRQTDRWDLRDPFDLVTAILPVRTRFEYRKRFGHTWEERIAAVRQDREDLDPEGLTTFFSDIGANALVPDYPHSDPAARAIWSDVATACWLMSFWTGTFDETDDPVEWLRSFEREASALRFMEGVTGYSTVGAKIPIRFVGCFDTVSALGLPFPRLNALIDRLPGMHHSFHDLRIPFSVQYAYQALALDDERRAFSPEVWKVDARVTKGRQVWFAGMHTDVGGGYVERGLSDITLSWMLRMGLEAGLLLDNNSNNLDIVEDPRGVMHDSMSTWKERWLYGKRPRTPADRDTFIVHRTAFERMNSKRPVWEWRKGQPMEVAADASRNHLRTLINGSPGDAPYRVEEPEPVSFDFDELIRAQEERWTDWVDRGYPSQDVDHERF